MTKPTLWLFIGALDDPAAAFAIATTAWVAREKGVLLEGYLESQRSGQLFAKTGSTVLGGSHHQQFNYLNARAEVKILALGEPHIFASSIAAFGIETIVQADSLADYYRKLFAFAQTVPERLLFAPCTVTACDGRTGQSAVLDMAPYLHAEIFFSHAAAYPADYLSQADTLPFPTRERVTLWMPEQAGCRSLDTLTPADTYGSLTLRLANRHKARARGVAFGDPDAIRAQLPSLCMDERISVYAPALSPKAAEVALSSYAESRSAIAEETAALAREIGNPILVGRQTCDGDLFYWGSQGVAIQIMDPNRPAFPVVEKFPHVWRREGGSLWEEEPDDATLEKWAGEGKILSSLIFHSGEMAHNEAMLNLMDYCAATGLKLGLGAHWMSYRTCPQLWELLNLPRSRGGVRGLIEPLLHSGGLGIMAEADCPAEDFRRHCATALQGIRSFTGDEALPRGYYFFCDTDLPTLSRTSPALYQVLGEVGLRYAVSNACPGRNRLLKASIPVLTQTSRTICGGSPFVRITSAEDVHESGFAGSPGWFIGVLDAPVIAFSPYIWREGSRFCRLVEAIRDGYMVNVLPDTIARYAAILQRRGDLPEPVGEKA